jgi:small subunit ribosomal protein S16
MPLRIRLSRGGAKKRPFFRIVVADSRSPRDGRYIERLGTYDPMVPKDHADRLKFNEERIKYWLGVGALPSDRVARFLSVSGLVDAPAIHEQTKKDKPRKKTVERTQAKAEEAKAKADADAKAQAEAAAAPAEEAPVEAPAEEAPAEEAPAEEIKEEEKTEG